MRIRSFTLLMLLQFSALASTAGAERCISSVDLQDKLHGMWIGQLIGNAAGRSTEGHYDGPEPNPAPSVPWLIKQVWDADDDTDIEYVALHTLETYGFDCNTADIREQWLEHVAADGIYIANKQAWYLMLDGHLPPETGSRTYNQHWYSIDAQIGTETLGALSPGLPQVAADLTARFAQVTNAGHAVHAAQFYAVLYSEAFFESDVAQLITIGLEAMPIQSRTTDVVTDVLEWHRIDLVDGVPDWRTTRSKLYQKYQGPDSFGRYYNWVESTINTGATVLALLYGQGDFKETVQIAVLAGWDCDCNPATAGGLLGIINGLSQLPADLTDPALCGDQYLNSRRPGLPTLDAPLPQVEPISAIAGRMRVLAEENILRNGGYQRNGRFTGFFYLPEHGQELYDPNTATIPGPASLVARAIAAGMSVTPDASVARYDETSDRYNLHTIIDGVTDNSLTGHRPYSTYISDPAQRPETDWFELRFSGAVRFDGLTFYEGDLLWAAINTYYRDDQPRGGYFDDLNVQVRADGQYVTPENLKISTAMSPFAIYQTLAFAFAPIVGDAIRIVGTPGGTDGFTTILELEPSGELYAGPQVVTVMLGDGHISPVDHRKLLLAFSEPVDLELQDIQLTSLSSGTQIDLTSATLLQNAPRRKALLTLPEILPQATYSLGLKCAAITDRFALPLADNDQNPTDGLWTATFAVDALPAPSL